MRDIDIIYKEGILEYISSVLTIVFVVLKLTNNISWSWVWVLSPLWIHLILLLLAIIFVGLCYILTK